MVSLRNGFCFYFLAFCFPAGDCWIVMCYSALSVYATVHGWVTCYLASQAKYHTHFRNS